jgi:aminopeptidase N
VRQATVRIDYSATPARGLYFLAPDADVPDRPEQVWSQCQDEDGRHWFPCHDKPHVKMTTEMRVVVPAGMTALSNGDLIFHDTPQTGDSWVYHYKLEQPHPSYLITLAVGRFDVVKDRDARVGDRSIAVTYFVPPGKKVEATRSLGQTPRMIELFSRLTGVDYPFSRYSQVVVSDFIFGGMENTTATTLYEHVLLDERAALDVSSEDLVAHELAHQWFGDLVTCRDWSHGWLNEGFATFFEHVEREDRLGLDEYEHGLERDMAAYLTEAGSRYQRPVVCREYEAPIDLFDRHLYEKGGLVLHMLRRQLGDVVFWRGVGAYLRAHSFGIVETTNFQRALEEASGQSLDQFFDQWLLRPGHPALRVKLQWEDGKLGVSVKQTHKQGDAAVFSFPLEVAVMGSDGEVRNFEKLVTEKTDALTVALSERPLWVAVDPRFLVAADWTVEAPQDWLRNCLEQAEPARLRLQAVKAMTRRQDVPTVEALGKALVDEAQPWMVRAEAARALGKIRGDDALAHLLSAADTEHPKVRRSVAGALGNFRVGRAAKVLGRLAKKDISYLVQAESARALGKTRHKNAAKTLVPLLDRSSWADVTRAGALEGLAALRDDEQLDTIARFTRYGVPVRGRRAAISAMARLSDSRRTREQLEDMLEDSDPHLRIDVIAALESLGDPKARGALNRGLARELDGRVVRRTREALRALGGSAATEQKRLSDELDTVRGELSELKVRLSKLEGDQPEKKTKEAPPTKIAETKSGPSSRRKKTASKKTASKKAASKKAASKKAASKKAASKKAASKKTGATQSPAEPAAPAKPAARRKKPAKQPSSSAAATVEAPQKQATKRRPASRQSKAPRATAKQSKAERKKR